MLKRFILLSFVLYSAVIVLAEEIDINNNCAKDEKCVDQKLKDIVERIDDEKDITLIDGVQLTRVKDAHVLDGARKMDESLGDRVLRYVLTHELKFEDDVKRSPRSYDEESRTRKLKKLLIPLLLALKLKFAIILPAVLSTIALISVKALVAGFIALLLSDSSAFSVHELKDTLQWFL